MSAMIPATINAAISRKVVEKFPNNAVSVFIRSPAIGPLILANPAAIADNGDSHI
jgi:hypothetical protein